MNLGHVASTQHMWFYLPPLYRARKLTAFPSFQNVFQISTYYLFVIQNSEVKLVQRSEKAFFLLQHFFLNTAKA